MTIKRVTYIEFGPDLSEQLVEGEVWSSAPAAGTFWVLPCGSRWPAVLVARATRRLRVGAVVDGRWDPRGGRWVDKGTWYTETHPRSALARGTASGARMAPPPAAIRMKPLDDHDMRSLSGL